jgi:hypothetical protein
MLFQIKLLLSLKFIKSENKYRILALNSTFKRNTLGVANMKIVINLYVANA